MALASAWPASPSTQSLSFVAKGTSAPPGQRSVAGPTIPGHSTGLQIPQRLSRHL